MTYFTHRMSGSVRKTFFLEYWHPSGSILFNTYSWHINFGAPYFEAAYFGAPYFGAAYFGAPYFGAAYFGAAYFVFSFNSIAFNCSDKEQIVKVLLYTV